VGQRVWLRGGTTLPSMEEVHGEVQRYVGMDLTGKERKIRGGEALKSSQKNSRVFGAYPWTGSQGGRCNLENNQGKSF